jgi:hypothetical protein
VAPSYARWLAVTALACAVLHHLGSLPDGLGDGPDGTRWADWLDLAVPWLVLTPAALTLWADRSPPRTWIVFGAGVVAYTSGHGIHLAANSVGNATPVRPRTSGTRSSVTTSGSSVSPWWRRRSPAPWPAARDRARSATCWPSWSG